LLKGRKLFTNVPGVIVQAISISVEAPDERWRKKSTCY